MTASWVVAETGKSKVKLPAEGGTVAVDLVLTGSEAIKGFEGRVAVDAAGVVSVVSADDDETAGVLQSYGLIPTEESQPGAAVLQDEGATEESQPGAAVLQDEGATEESQPGAAVPQQGPASAYNFELVQWFLVHADGTAEPGTDGVDLAGEPGASAFAMAAPLDVIDGPIRRPAGELFLTDGGFGAMLQGPVTPSDTPVLTLTLSVAGIPGTYRASLADASVTDAGGLRANLTLGPELVITVPSQ